MKLSLPIHSISSFIGNNMHTSDHSQIASNKVITAEDLDLAASDLNEQDGNDLDIEDIDESDEEWDDPLDDEEDDASYYSIFLSDNEFDELREYLETLNNTYESGCMSIEIADGFLTANAINPMQPEFATIIPQIFNLQEPAHIATIDKNKIEIIKKRYTELQLLLELGEGSEPIIFPFADEENGLILEGEESIHATHPWAIGFLFGSTKWPGHLLTVPKVMQTLSPILACLGTVDELPDDLSVDLQANVMFEMCKNARRALGGMNNLDDALQLIRQSTVALYKYLNSTQQPIHRQERRIGRNEPCPCGSGKKYKHCCGKRY